MILDVDHSSNRGRGVAIGRGAREATDSRATDRSSRGWSPRRRADAPPCRWAMRVHCHSLRIA